MKPICVAFLLAALLNIVGARPARAQFSAAGPSAQAATSTKKYENTYFGGVSIYPVAVFDAGGRFNVGNNGTTSLAGGLISLEGGVINGGTRGNGMRYSLGGWYWGRAGEDLYEVHARLQTKSNIGVQFGYLNTAQGFLPRAQRFNSTKVDAEAYDIFLLYTINGTRRPPLPDEGGPRRVSRAFNNNWNVEFGLGTYIDVSQHYIGPSNQTLSKAATANYTFYVSGAYQIAPHWWVQASEWVLRIRSQDLNRLAVGLAFTF